MIGAVLAALALGGVTYALIQWGGQFAPWAALAGVAAGLAFVVTERREREPMLPLGLFSSRTFSAANVMTLLVYAALGAILFFLVLQLQTVGGYGALAAGLATLPITVCMLFLAAKGGELGTRIGPRIPMTFGPMVMAVGVLLLLGVDEDVNYWLDVLPGLTIFGLGLALMVAPLTATVLAAAPDEHAGIASGVNNAVARAGSLLAVAALPVAVGLMGEEYADPQAFDSAYGTAMLICAGLLVAGGVVSWFTIRPTVLEYAGAEPCRSARHVGWPHEARRAPGQVRLRRRTRGDRPDRRRVRRGRRGGGARQRLGDGPLLPDAATWAARTSRCWRATRPSASSPPTPRRSTSRLLVTGVTYRHPGLLAKIVTTLDVLSGGRAVLGLGAAWYQQEHEALGVPFPPVAERFERLEETLQIVPAMFEDDGRRRTTGSTTGWAAPSTARRRCAGRRSWSAAAGSGRRSDWSRSTPTPATSSPTPTAGPPRCSRSSTCCAATASARGGTTTRSPRRSSGPADVDTSDGQAFAQQVQGFADIGVTEVHVMHTGDRPVEFVQELGRSVVPALRDI